MKKYGEDTEIIWGKKLKGYISIIIQERGKD